MNTFVTLLKREYWENKGGFYYAPIITGSVLLVLFLVAWAFVAAIGQKTGSASFIFNLSWLMNRAQGVSQQDLAQAYEIGLVTIAGGIHLVLTIVSFFYCLGSLYDDRRDRSILFWKSMPISDVQTVLSKLVAIAVLAPLIAFVATIVTHVALLAAAALVVTVHGGAATTLVFGPAEPLAFWPRMLANAFVNAVWLAPMYGWLMLVSSFSRSKPFLWAIFPPIILGIVWSASQIYRFLWLPEGWVWKNVVGRILPFFGFELSGNGAFRIFGMSFGRNGPSLSWSDIGAVLTSLETWYGVFAAAVMIAGAIWFRRKRELAD